MKTHILFKHPVVWCRWKNANLTFVAIEQHWAKPKKRCNLMVMGSSQINGNVNLYKKEDAQQNKFMEDLFVAKTYMLIFVVEKQWLRCLVMHQNP
jgi:hypothetical protein